MLDVKEMMLKQIGLELQVHKEGILQEAIEKRLGHGVSLEDVSGRMVHSTDTFNHETFILDGVALVTFSPLKTIGERTGIANTTFKYKIYDDYN